MLAYINLKHPNYLKSEERVAEAVHSKTAEPKLQVDVDVIIGVLKDKKLKAATPLFNVGKWDKDLLYSIIQRTKAIDLLNVLA